MAEIRPRVLADRLGELSSEVQRWASAADAGVTAGTRDLETSLDRGHRVLQASATTRNATEEFATTLETARSEHEHQDAAAWELHEQATQRARRARKAIEVINEVRQQWRQQHEAAVVQRDEVRRRLERLRDELLGAESELRSVERDLQAALADLRACRSARPDDHGRRPDCGGIERRADQLQATADHISTRCAQLRQAVAVAQTELHQAEVRVDCTKNAIEAATEASAVATEAEATLGTAVAHSIRGIDELREAGKALDVAAQRHRQAVDLASQLESNQLQLTDRLGEAQAAMTDASRAHRSGTDTSGASIRSLRSRADELRHLDRTTGIT